MKRLAFICCILIAAASGELGFAQDNDTLRIVGSKYAAYTVTDLATSYVNEHQEAKIKVADGEAFTGLQSIVKQNCDALALFGQLDSDDKAEAAEKGVHLKETIIGWGAVVIITDPKNPINELSFEQVRKMFSGDLKNWKQVGGNDLPIIAVTRDEAVSGTERMFRELVLQGFPIRQDAVRLLEHDVVRAVWKNPGSIADARFTEAIRGRIKGMVKVIAIRENDNSPAVMPSLETLKNKTYPLSAPLTIYTDAKKFNGHMAAFTDFCAKRGLVEKFTELKTK